MTTEATVVFVVVVGAAVPRSRCSSRGGRCPRSSPAWCSTASTRSIFQAFGFDPPGYQNYDKAMDLFYLSIAYLATLRNWTRSVGRRHLAVPVLLPDGRGDGVRDHRRAHAAAGLPEHLRVLLHRLRGRAAALGPAAVQPAVLGRHRGAASGSSSSCRRSTGSTSPSSTSPTPGRTCRGSPPLIVGAVLVGLAILWFVVRPRLLPADWSWRVAADPLPEEMDTAAERDAWTAANVRVWSWSTLEKVVLIGLLSTIYARILPGLEVSDLRMFVGIAAYVVVNAAISIAFAKRAGTREGLAGDFGVRVVVNLGLVLLARLVLGAGRARPVGDALLRAAGLAARHHARPVRPGGGGARRARPRRPRAGRGRPRPRPT